MKVVVGIFVLESSACAVCETTLISVFFDGLLSELGILNSLITKGNPSGSNGEDAAQ